MRTYVGKIPLEIQFVYFGNKDIYCTFKTCCIIFIFHKFAILSYFVEVHFFINVVQKFKYPQWWDKDCVQLLSFSHLMYFTLTASVCILFKVKFYTFCMLWSYLVFLLLVFLGIRFAFCVDSGLWCSWFWCLCLFDWSQLITNTEAVMRITEQQYYHNAVSCVCGFTEDIFLLPLLFFGCWTYIINFNCAI